MSGNGRWFGPLYIWSKEKKSQRVGVRGKTFLTRALLLARRYLFSTEGGVGWEVREQEEKEKNDTFVPGEHRYHVNTALRGGDVEPSGVSDEGSYARGGTPLLPQHAESGQIIGSVAVAGVIPKGRFSGDPTARKEGIEPMGRRFALRIGGGVRRDQSRNPQRRTKGWISA